MDLVGLRQSCLPDRRRIRRFAAPLGLPVVECVPAAARFGDNIFAASPAIPWYRGPTLMEHLESIEVVSRRRGNRSAFPCNGSIGPTPIFAGSPAGGERPGAARAIRGGQPSGRGSRVAASSPPRRPPEAAAGDRHADVDRRIDSPAATCWCRRASGRCRRPVRRACGLVRGAPLMPGRRYLLGSARPPAGEVSRR